MRFKDLLSKKLILILGSVCAVILLLFGAVEMSEKVLPEKIQSSGHPTLNYSKHPSLKECEDVKNKFQRQFCVADVAEIKGNITLCQKVEEEYGHIRNFCEARITLNETKCNQLNDEKLVQSCLESIRLKREWRNNTKFNK